MHACMRARAECKTDLCPDLEKWFMHERLWLRIVKWLPGSFTRFVVLTLEKAYSWESFPPIKLLYVQVSKVGG